MRKKNIRNAWTLKLIILLSHVVFDEISSYYGAAAGAELNSQKFEAVELPTSFNSPSTCLP